MVTLGLKLLDETLPSCPSTHTFLNPLSWPSHTHTHHQHTTNVPLGTPPFRAPGLAITKTRTQTLHARQTLPPSLLPSSSPPLHPFTEECGDTSLTYSRQSVSQSHPLTHT